MLTNQLAIFKRQCFIVLKSKQSNKAKNNNKFRDKLLWIGTGEDPFSGNKNFSKQGEERNS